MTMESMQRIETGESRDEVATLLLLAVIIMDWIGSRSSLLHIFNPVC